MVDADKTTLHKEKGGALYSGSPRDVTLTTLGMMIKGGSFATDTDRSLSKIQRSFLWEPPGRGLFLGFRTFRPNRQERTPDDDHRRPTSRTPGR